MFRTFRFPVFTAILLLLFLPVSCQVPPKELGNPQIRGTINGISSSKSDSDLIGFMLIEGKMEEDTVYERALVTLQRQTAIYRREGGKTVRTTFPWLKEGMIVEVWFSGPVAESDPVQAAADTIIVINQ